MGSLASSVSLLYLNFILPWYQAIAMGLKCHGVAQSLGERHNESAGVTPLQWLEHFGTSLNRGSGLKDMSRPLPLICRSTPSDHTFTSYDDGRFCPSLQNFLELSVEDLTLSRGKGTGDLFIKGSSCRLRLLGNAMSRPPLPLGDLRPSGPDGDSTATLSPKEETTSSSPSKPVMYPVDHDLETTLLVIEVCSKGLPKAAPCDVKHK